MNKFSIFFSFLVVNTILSQMVAGSDPTHFKLSLDAEEFRPSTEQPTAAPVSQSRPWFPSLEAWLSPPNVESSNPQPIKIDQRILTEISRNLRKQQIINSLLPKKPRDRRKK